MQKKSVTSTAIVAVSLLTSGTINTGVTNPELEESSCILTIDVTGHGQSNDAGNQQILIMINDSSF